jgi:hypothetical protein
MSEVVSIRLPKGTVARLKMLSFRLSLEQKKEIRWTALLKEAVEKVFSSHAAEEVNP